MCEYCLAEGCAHDLTGWHKTACRCSLSGPSTCEECGHECAPWYQGLEVPGRENLSGLLFDFTEGGNYPATKGAIVAYLKDNSSQDADWLSAGLPDRSFSDAGEVMLALIPPIQSPEGDTVLTKSPMRVVASGMKLVVHDGETAVMVGSKSNSALDVFPTGTHVISSSNCPLLAAKSRSPAAGFDKMVMDGGPVFISAQKKLRLSLTAIGQTGSGKPGGAKVTTEISVHGPREFVNFVLSNLRTEYDDASLTSALNSRFISALRTALAATDLEVLKNDHGVLERPIVESAAQIGLVATVSIEYAGEPTPDLAMGMMNQTMGDISARMAAAQQAMKIAQQRQGMSGPMPQPFASGQAPSTQSTGITCPKCNFKNPPSARFCNNCGTPVGKKVCGKCGAENGPTTNFCGNCGSKL